MLVSEGSVDRIRMVDTVGSAIPLATKFLIGEMKKIIPDIPIEAHFHNDFGLATANTLAAAECGVEVLSTTMNGLGERSGNTPTEEVAVALKVLYDIDLGINLEKLYSTARFIEKISGIKLQPHKAVVGRNSFAHESGMVVAGILKMPFTGEAYSPEMVGQKRKIIIGKQSGIQTIKYYLEKMKLNASDDQARAIVERVKEIAIKNKRSLTDKEFLGIANDILY